MVKHLPCQWCQKKAKIIALVLDRRVFKTKTVTNKEGHHIIGKRTIQEEDITIANIYAPNIGVPKYIKQLITRTKELINNYNNSRGL